MYRYEGKVIIAWFSYRRDYRNKKGVNKVCYIYPRYVKVDGIYRSLAEEQIESNERIDMVIKKEDLVAESVWKDYGYLVTVKFRVEPHRSTLPATGGMNNDAVYDDESADAGDTMDIDSDNPENFAGKNQTSVFYHPDHLNPQLEIRKFKEAGFFLVLETTDSFEELLRNRCISISQQLYTEELDVLVGSGDSYYGPFKIRTEDGKVQLAGRREQEYQIKKYQREDIEKNCMPIADSEDVLQVTLLWEKRLYPLPVESIDWITDGELVDELTRMFKKTSTSTTKKIMTTITEFASQVNTFEMDAGRKARIQGVLERIQSQENYLDSLIDYIYENPQHLNTLIEYVSEKRFDIFENKNRDIVKLKARLSELQAEVKQLNEDKTQLDEAIVKAKRESDQIDASKTLLEAQLDVRIAEFNDQSRALGHLLDHRLLQGILGQHIDDPEPEEALVEADAPVVVAALPQLSDLGGESVIDMVLAFMKTVPREVEYNEVVNYLVCITQGFITTFAGEPGTGKTSLCNLLAKSLGLVRENGAHRFVDISVERGWMSHKDFIGYYNPLTKTMEKSNNRVFDALAMLSAEGEEAVSPFLILLDEANLSPIEHYWAAFLRLCDFDSTSSRSLNIGGADSWNIPPQLRFLATVNFDHTTEELSPRFLDRSWIIKLGSRNISENLLAEGERPGAQAVQPLLSYAALRRAFMPARGDALPRELTDKWNEIQQTFDDYHLPLAMRNQKMVHDYCTTAYKYMNKRAEAHLTPLDYAVAQKILPLINGRGEQYKKLLLSLQKICDTLPLCHEHIERMIGLAKENMEYYQFFAK
ncbi:MAG: AAA family ATPase [Treponema sp.]|jgi:MoxR-like ATPase|nr:AAA family ATPase [Treponema sp.]